MSNLHSFQAGGYAFLEGGFPYSAGVIAAVGFRLVRVRFKKQPTMADGFVQIAAHLKARGRPLTALCATELRSPKPFTFAGFHEFNQSYVDVLTQWGLVRNSLNPVARSNVCPVFDPPSAPGFHAFTYTMPEPTGSAPGSIARDYVVAGSGEWPEGQAFPEKIVARADLSPQGLAAKVSFVLETMKQRCQGLQGDWQRISAVQIYTAENFHALLSSHFAAAGMMPLGLSWHVCKPPILELEFEMDVRSVGKERVLF